MVRRIFLFLLTNILVIATISIVLSLLGVHGYLTQHGINFKALLIFCVIWGMGGAFISLLISRWMAKKFMRVRVIDPSKAFGNEQKLVTVVHRLATRAGLSTMPEVGIYDSPEFNAFATGPNKRKTLVAVSSGLLSGLNDDELSAVIGHEITHITNGDMVTMTLIQGVVNAFAMFLSRIVAYAVATAISRGDNDREGGISYLTYYICVIVFDIIFTILGSLVTAAFSRWREFRADSGGAKLTSRDKMIAALRRLEKGVDVPEDKRARAMAMLKISRRSRGGMLRYFASHPPIEQRIKALQQPTSH